MILQTGTEIQRAEQVLYHINKSCITQYINIPTLVPTCILFHTFTPTLFPTLGIWKHIQSPTDRHTPVTGRQKERNGEGSNYVNIVLVPAELHNKINSVFAPCSMNMTYTIG